MLIIGSSTYIRHRVRMIQESILDDLKNTLIACRWVAGTTSLPVNNPETLAYEVVTTTEDETFGMIRTPIQVVDVFPEDAESARVNTIAVGPGERGEDSLVEMGNGQLREQPYTFSIALFLESDALAQAILSDLQDRYAGRIVNGESIPLINFNDDPDTPVAYLEVETFRFARDASMAGSSAGELFFAEINIVDYA